MHAEWSTYIWAYRLCVTDTAMITTAERGGGGGGGGEMRSSVKLCVFICMF